MAYIVIAYPKISQKDFEFIQTYRKENDPRYFSVINPHITLVFAISDIDKKEFIDEVTKQVTDFKKFSFQIKVATINQDDSGDYYHEFLVPDEGYSNIVKLHDKLYSDKFSKYLRFDIDFIPHIGIGNSNDAQISKKRIDELNAQDLFITGYVESIQIIEYTDGVIKPIQEIALS